MHVLSCFDVDLIHGLFALACSLEINFDGGRLEVVLV